MTLDKYGKFDEKVKVYKVSYGVLYVEYSPALSVYIITCPQFLVQEHWTREIEGNLL